MKEQPLEVFCKKGVFKNFAKFTEKHLCQSLFFKKLQASACNFIKKETLAQVFSCEICEIFKNIYFTEYPRTTASENLPKLQKSRDVYNYFPSRSCRLTIKLGDYSKIF